MCNRMEFMRCQRHADSSAHEAFFQATLPATPDACAGTDDAMRFSAARITGIAQWQVSLTGQSCTCEILEEMSLIDSLLQRSPQALSAVTPLSSAPGHLWQTAIR